MIEATPQFELHPGRGRFNAAFFRGMDGYINWHLRRHKEQVYANLPSSVIELGPGVGANLRYLRPGTRLIAIEPNLHMHPALQKRAEKSSIELEIKSVIGEAIDLPDQSADAVISSLVLCSVADPSVVVSEVRRILKPRGRFCFVEHVAARKGTPTRVVQRAVRRPWAWVFEGCSCERDLERVVLSAGFTEVHHHPYRIHSPFLPFNTQISGVAIA